MKKRGFLGNVLAALKDTEKQNSPVVIKESTDIQQELDQLQQMLNQTIDSNEQQKLSKQIHLLELGMKGEETVLFELKNAFLPIHILHDIRINHQGNSAQLDFVLLTRKFILVLEVKNYYGNIKVTNKDEFVRKVYKNNRLVFEEGFYSPIRQVERQTQLLGRLLTERGIVTQTPIYYGVVFTNAKTIIDAKHASIDVQNKILRADQLVKFIEKLLKETSPVHFFDNRMAEMSSSICNLHQPKIEVNEETVVEKQLLEETVETKHVEETNTLDNIEEILRDFRKQQAEKLNVKAYYIFTNETLEELIRVKPTKIEELKTIRGFGNAKIEQFGNDLLELFNFITVNK